MADTTKIEWARNTDGSRGATFNPWVGCTKVGPGCDHCYAESWAKRAGSDVWGPHAERRRTTAQNWKKPIKWNRDAAERGIRIRVFGGSLCDPFDNAVPESWRVNYFDLIRETPNLDWIIVTKRIGNVAKMLPAWWDHDYGRLRRNVWLLATICTQEEADRDIPKLQEINPPVRGLSMEPLLEAVNIEKYLHNLNWIIAGDESGPGARPGNEDRIRSLRDQCQAAGVAFFYKQKVEDGRKISLPELDGRTWDEIPEPRP